MNNRNISQKITESCQKGQKQLAVLIDPDKVNPRSLNQLIKLAALASVDYFFIGGSLIVNNSLDTLLQHIDKDSDIPKIIFPGNNIQVSKYAEAILFLSLISGRNPEFLIGQQVVAAPLIKSSGLEVLPTGYMLIDGKAPTSVSYMSHTHPIPRDKDSIAICTALAGQYLGLGMIYMDAGSGAKETIPEEMIRSVKSNISIPLIIGGGIKDAGTADGIAKAGADIIVVGNILEKSPELVLEIGDAIHKNSLVVL